MVASWKTNAEAVAVMPANAAESLNEADSHAARNDLRSAMDSVVVAFCQIVTTYMQGVRKEWVDAPGLLRGSAFALEHRLDTHGYALLQRYAPKNLTAAPYGDHYVIQRSGSEPRPTDEEYARCYSFVVDSALRLLGKP